MKLLLEQRQTVSPQMVLANRLLKLSSLDLEQTITEELAENPVLELTAVQRCPRCGRELSNGYCETCGKPAESSAPAGPAAGRSADARDDPTSCLVATTTLADHVLAQVRVSLPPADWTIASCVVENLDDHGFLACSADEVAARCSVDRAHVERVLQAMHRLEPVGIAAADVRDCLLIQLEQMETDDPLRPLAATIIREQWDELANRAFGRIARATGATEADVRSALQLIKANLNPFPAHVYWEELHGSPAERTRATPRPDIIIQRRRSADEPTFEIVLPGAAAYRLHVSRSYLEARETVRKGDRTAGPEWERWESFHRQARLFIRSIEQRWETLRQLALLLVDCQRDFLLHGDKHLIPLTRAELATKMDVHESTVSRAVAGKYAQLPSGRIIPVSRFFDHTVPAKEMIKEIVAQEETPLSDREIAALLCQRGRRLARRTVTKYRNAMNILPSPLR